MQQEGRYVLEAAAFPDNAGFKKLLTEMGNVEQVEREGDFYVIRSISDIKRELLRKCLEEGYTLQHLRQRGNDLDEIYRRYFEKAGQIDGNDSERKNKAFISFGRK